VKHGPVRLWQCSNAVLRRWLRQTPPSRSTRAKSSSKTTLRKAFRPYPSKPLRTASPPRAEQARKARLSPPLHGAASPTNHEISRHQPNGCWKPSGLGTTGCPPLDYALRGRRELYVHDGALRAGVFDASESYGHARHARRVGYIAVTGSEGPNRRCDDFGPLPSRRDAPRAPLPSPCRLWRSACRSAEYPSTM